MPVPAPPAGERAEGGEARGKRRRWRWRRKRSGPRPEGRAASEASGAPAETGEAVAAPPANGGRPRREAEQGEADRRDPDRRSPGDEKRYSGPERRRERDGGAPPRPRREAAEAPEDDVRRDDEVLGRPPMPVRPAVRGPRRPFTAARESFSPRGGRGVVVPPAPALKVLIAGGGTGGHITPALSVAEEIRRRNGESRVLFVGTRKGLEARLVPESGFAIEYLDLSGYAGRGIFSRVKALWQFGAGLMKMRGVIRRFQPELVLGTGGYVSGPAVLAGRWAGVRTIVQEQNSIPGKMNRVLARFVDEVHVAFTESRMFFGPKGKIRLSGNPTRMRPPRGSLANIYARYGLRPERMTVLVVGGSRGARSLNKAVVEMLPQWSGREDVQFILVTGSEDLAMVEEAVRRSGVPAVARAFLTPIEEAYAITTLVVCRAGAMTLAEIGQFALPAVLVPFPYAIYQHQLRNAEILRDKGAADLIPDGDLSGPLLHDRIEALLGDQTRRREMGLNAFNLARPDAPERIVNAIENLTHPAEKPRLVDMVENEAGGSGGGAEE